MGQRSRCGAGTPGALMPAPRAGNCQDRDSEPQRLLMCAPKAEGRRGVGAAECPSSSGGEVARGVKLTPVTDEAEANAYDASKDTAENTLTYLTACGLSVGSAKSAQTTGAAPSGARRWGPGIGDQPPLFGREARHNEGASGQGEPSCGGRLLLGGSGAPCAGARSTSAAGSCAAAAAARLPGQPVGTALQKRAIARIQRTMLLSGRPAWARGHLRAEG